MQFLPLFVFLPKLIQRGVRADTDAVIEAFGKNEQVKKVFWTLFVAIAGLIEKEQVPLLYSSMELLFTQGPLSLKPAPQFMAEALSIALFPDTPVYDALFKSTSPFGSFHAGYCGSSSGALCKKYGVTAILV